MTAVGRFVVGNRRWVIGASIAFFFVAGALGAGVVDRLISGGFEVPSAESTRALEFLERELGEGEIDVAMIVTAKGGDVDAPAVAAAGRKLTQQLSREDGVTEAYSYWTLGSAPPLRSRNGDQASILARFDGDQDFVTDRLDVLTPKYTQSTNLIDVRVSGFGEVFRTVNKQIEDDLVRAEMIAIPVTGILLLFVFRSAIASVLPLAVGGLAVVGTLFVLRVISTFADISVFALNMTTAMSLGLAIDYSLFIVSRFREELARGLPSDEAVVRTVATAGRTVAFSAVTVAASLSALLLFPMAFLRSFGYAGMALVALAGVGAVITLPAILAVIGPRIDRWSIRRQRVRTPGTGGWHRLAIAVMRRPVIVLVGTTAVLLLLGAPFLRMKLGMPDPRVLPEDAPARRTVEEFNRNFSGNEGFPIFVVARGVVPAVQSPRIHALAGKMSSIPGVARIDAATGSYALGARIFSNASLAAQFKSTKGTYLRIVPASAIQPFSPRAEELITAIQKVGSPFPGVDLELAGQTAGFVDSREALFSRLPWALAAIGLVTLVVLFLAFGSIVVPLKAVVLNVLSLTATFGAMVWVFQDGHLSGLLGFTPREAIDVFNPILMFAIAFGISMDYEVFMLSRIREEYDRTGDNTASVAAGLERTGGLVTAAALVLAAVFLSQVSSQISIIKLFGLGLALAVLMDAFVVRTTLVPAFMRLAGTVNWWLPPSLRRLHDRFGFRESDGDQVAPGPSVEVVASAPAARKRTPVGARANGGRKKRSSSKSTRPLAPRKRS